MNTLFWVWLFGVIVAFVPTYVYCAFEYYTDGKSGAGTDSLPEILGTYISVGFFSLGSWVTVIFMVIPLAVTVVAERRQG